MSFTYNLITESWIPCRLKDDSQVYLSLRDTLTKAADIAEIIGDAPTVTIALHRLLIAVLHRCYMGPKNVHAWQRMWESGAFDEKRIDSYLAQHQTRFDLFDDAQPFYQTAAVGFDQQGTIARLFFQADANPTLFDHTFKDNPPALTPAEAARLLIAFQSFDYGGTKGHELNKKQDKYADASPLIQSAVGLVCGTNLFETLMFNLHRYDGGSSESPFAFNPEKDLPAWQRAEVTQPNDRSPEGYVDLLTWQSRRLRLSPDREVNGNIVVRNAVIMKGFQFPDGFERYNKETMIAFRKNVNATSGQRAWNSLRFDERKALWRDSFALFQATDAARTRPKILDWLSELADEEILDSTQALNIKFFGLIHGDNAANLLFWRYEQLALPLAYLSETNKSKLLRLKLREVLEHAESIAGALTYSSKVLATYLLAPNADHPNARQPDKKKDVNPLAGSFRLEAFFWSRLENRFKKLMTDLPHDVRTEKHGDEIDEIYGEQETARWIDALKRTARDALAHTTHSLDTSARNLKAAVQAERTLNRELRERLRGYESNTQLGEAA